MSYRVYRGQCLQLLLTVVLDEQHYQGMFHDSKDIMCLIQYRLKVIERALQALTQPVPVYTYYVARCIEVCCQHPTSARAVTMAGGARALLDFFSKNWRVCVLFVVCYHVTDDLIKVGLLPLCSTALRALRLLIRVVPDNELRSETRDQMEETLRPLFSYTFDTDLSPIATAAVR